MEAAGAKGALRSRFTPLFAKVDFSMFEKKWVFDAPFAKVYYVYYVYYVLSTQYSVLSTKYLVRRYGEFGEREREREREREGRSRPFQSGRLPGGAGRSR